VEDCTPEDNSTTFVCYLALVGIKVGGVTSTDIELKDGDQSNFGGRDVNSVLEGDFVAAGNA
jgi:hypothetical protein